jgi:CRP/FNR family transcriptional regulator
MIELNFLKQRFNYLGSELVDKIQEVSEILKVPAGTELVREGQYVKYVPIVISGLVKVFVQTDDKELLLYYIQPEQSCIMSFSAVMNDASSKIFAIAEDDSEILLVPTQHLLKWVIDYPAINRLFYKEYELRYTDLVDTINEFLYYKLDQRLLHYLQKRVDVTEKNPIKISHKEIANDLGTAREVISRLIKKFEIQNVLKQHTDGIEILEL